MSDGGVKSGEGNPSVGVVTSERDTERIVERVANAGGNPAVGPAADVVDADVVVAVGVEALGDLATAGTAAPVLPVSVNDITAVPLERCERALEDVFAGEYTIQEHPLVRAVTPDGDDRALFDVALQTVAPASISEFSLDVPSSRYPTEDGETERVARFRADGIVVATPIGSRGYARAAGGPVVVPGIEVVSVVPVAPFATDPDHWVVPLSALALTVERDEVDVELSVDGRPIGTVTARSTVELARDGKLRVAITDESRPVQRQE